MPIAQRTYCKTKGCKFESVFVELTKGNTNIDDQRKHLEKNKTHKLAIEFIYLENIVSNVHNEQI